jgi:putative ABC transport system permease protein
MGGMTFGKALRRAAMALRMAGTALTRNRLRTTLTGVGIAIGTTAVIATVAIGEGGAAQIHQQFLLLGDNLVWIQAGGRTVNGLRIGTGSTPTLVLGDMVAALDAAPGLKACSPQVDSSAQVIHGNQNWHTAYRGVAPEYVQIRRWQIASGDMFTAEQVTTAANVCLLGRTVVERLFPDEDPVGQIIRVRSIPFRVVGTLGAKGHNAVGQDQDDFIMVPYTTAQRKLKGVTWFDDLMCSAEAPDEVPGILAAVVPLLRMRHHVGPGEQDDFNIRRPEDLIKAQEETARTLTALLASVAGISLLVGGVGIMNIMLVSVSERTREIGLRMAVGARERDIRRQFLAEAVVLCLGGCAVGVLAGVLLSQAIAETLSWPLLLSPAAILVSVAASLGTGVAFGYYPARRASRKDPIDALRSE